MNYYDFGPEEADLFTAYYAGDFVPVPMKASEMKQARVEPARPYGKRGKSISARAK